MRYSAAFLNHCQTIFIPMIRPLTPADADVFAALRRQSFITDPLSWDHDPDARVVAEEWAPRLEETDDKVVYGFFQAPGELVGVIGLRRFTKRKRRHRAMIWGVYVAPGARGQGVGRQLLARALARARRMEGLDHLVLSLSHHAAAADKLYARAGFVVWGREIRAACTDGVWMDEVHLRLDLT